MAIPQGVATNVNNALHANQQAVTANRNLTQGNGSTSGNLSRVNQTANTAASQYSAAVNKLNNIRVNGNKNHLNRAKKQFTLAAMNSASNQPLKAVNNARMGINALRSYTNSAPPNRS